MAPLVTIAYSHHPTDAALWSAALETAGFDVFLPHFHTCHMMQHWMVALGGIAITVPHDQATEARSFLAAHIEPDTKPEPLKGRKAFWRIILFYIYYKTGIAPAFSGLFLTSEHDPKTE